MKTFTRGLDPKDSMQIGLLYGVFDRVQPLIDEIVGDENPITMTARLTDDLGMDSLDIVEFIMKVEKEFDLTIDDNDPLLNNIKTVGDVVNALKDIILKK
jgi:acyl carrier protein